MSSSLHIYASAEHAAGIGHEVTPMSKTKFYMVIFVMVVHDIVQSRYKKKLMTMERAREVS
mgnify:CR=1 FL=1